MLIDPSDIDMIVNIILVGDTSVGKTNLCKRFTEDTFSEDSSPTIGADFLTKVVTINDLQINIKFWDTAGQERYKAIGTKFYKQAQGVVLVYDVTRRESYENLNKWIADVNDNTQSDVKTVLVGNKVDLKDEREISVNEGESIAKTYDFFFMETSAKTSYQVDKAFNILLQSIVDQEIQKNNEDDQLSGGRDSKPIPIDPDDLLNVNEFFKQFMKIFITFIMIFKIFNQEKIRIDIDDMQDIFIGNVPDSQKCQIWKELKFQAEEKFVIVNFQQFTLNKNPEGYHNMFKEFDAQEVYFKQQTHWQELQLEVKAKYRMQINFELDLPFDFQPQLEYACSNKHTTIIDENNQKKNILLFNITGYDNLFDISMIDYKEFDNKIQVYIYKSIFNHSQYFNDVKIVKIIELPKDEQLQEIDGFQFTISRKKINKAKDFILNNKIESLPYKFEQPLRQLNNFFILGSNDQNEVQIETKIENIDGQKYQRIHFRVISAYFEYSIERDTFQEKLNTSNDKCYNIVINYIHQEIINKAILGQFQLGCFNQDVRYSLQKFFLFDIGTQYMQWGYLGVDKTQSNTITFIIRTDMERLSIKKQYIYSPFFKNTGFVYPRIHIKNNKIYALLLYNDRNLVGINFNYETPRMEQYRSLNKLSGRLSGIDEVASQDCLIDNRQFKNQNLADNSQLKDFSEIYVSVIDRFIEKNINTRNKLSSYFTNTLSEKIYKKKLIGPFFINDGILPTCWIHQDHYRLNLFLLASSLGSPFTDSLIVIKKHNKMLNMQIFKDKSTQLCKSNMKYDQDIDIFSTEVDINYKRTIDNKISQITTHFIQNEEYITYHNYDSLVIVDKHDVLKINDFVSCQIFMKDNKIIIDANIFDEKQIQLYNQAKKDIQTQLLLKMRRIRQRKEQEKLKNNEKII